MRKSRFTLERIGELLVKRGIITKGQCDRALEIQKNTSILIGEVFIKLNFAKEKDIVAALISQYHFPYISLNNYSIDAEILNSIPENIARKHLVMPLDKISNSFTVAMANPLDEKAIAEIETLLHCRVQPFIATASDISNSITRYYMVDKCSPLFPDHLRYS